jgi:hypothetical protein
MQFQGKETENAINELRGQCGGSSKNQAFHRITFTVKEGFRGENFFKALSESKLWDMFPPHMARLKCVQNGNKVSIV